MILREPTIKYKGYDPEDLKPKSTKRICCSCDKCGRVRYVRFYQYTDLCRSCSLKGRILSDETKQKISKNHADMSGKNNPMYGIKRSQKTRQKMSNAQKGKKLSDETKKRISDANRGKNHPLFGKQFLLKSRIKMSCAHQGISIDEFTGFVGRHPERNYLNVEKNCTKLNTKFEGSEFHHIISSVGIYIPKNIHKTNHSIKNNINMDIINKIAIDYLIGDNDPILKRIV